MAMVSLRLFSFICFFNIVISQTTAQPKFIYHLCSNDKGNYTANSTYQTNLKTLLSNLASNTQIDYGFYNFSYGQNPDRVNAIGLCRGDVRPDVCRSCLDDSRVLLTQLCPNQKEAIGFYDNCMLRYSNRSISGVMEDSPWYYSWEGNNVTDADQYNQVLYKLLPELQSIAATGDSRIKFATGNATGPNFQKIYALVQCTPDLNAQVCGDCLSQSFSEIRECCDRKGGVIIGRPSCNVRYEKSLFYGTASGTPPQANTTSKPPQANTTSKQGKNNRLRSVIAIVLPVVAFITLVIFVCIYLRVRRSRKNVETEDDSEIISIEQLQFSYDTVKDATNNFSDENKLGKGGYGPVYKGILSDGREIAVKRLSMNSSQGDAEFKNEVMLLAKLQHRNLVRLLGFCLERKERLLIYEFVPNKSLDKFIFDPTNNAYIGWQLRYKIIEGIARGLLYLHQDSQLCIIHRDLKASNILLDAEMNSKISDFGMARQVAMDQTNESTSRIVGTYGYMAPEYVMHGKFSLKSDVYSFGVMILEIVSGYKSNNPIGQNEEYLLSFAWKNWREETALNIVDPNLIDGSTNEIIRCIHIGLLCVQDNVADRPTMASVVLMLNSSTTTLAIPSKPAFFVRSGNLPALQSGEYNSGSAGTNQPVHESQNEASNTEPYPR